MFWLVIDPGWVLYAYAVDAAIAVPRMGSITQVLYPWWAQRFPCSLGFFASYPGQVVTSFVIPWGPRIWVSSPMFLLYCLRYLLLWVLVFWKLRRLSGQPAEAKAQAYGACFEGVRVIGKLFEGLQHMGRVHQGRVGRSHFSCRSHGLCPLPAVSSTVIGISRRLPSTVLFTLSSGCIRLQEWTLLPYTPPLSPRRRELFLLFANEPLIGKNPSRWPISSNLLKGLTLAIFCI